MNGNMSQSGRLMLPYDESRHDGLLYLKHIIREMQDEGIVEGSGSFFRLAVFNEKMGDPDVRARWRSMLRDLNNNALNPESTIWKARIVSGASRADDPLLVLKGTNFDTWRLLTDTIFLYVVYCFWNQWNRQRGSGDRLYRAFYGATARGPTTPVPGVPLPIWIRDNGEVSLRWLIEIAIQLFTKLREALGDTVNTLQGSDSGMVMSFRAMRDVDTMFRLHLEHALGVRPGQRWLPEVYQPIMDKLFSKRGLMTVSNTDKDDELCMFHAILLGLMRMGLDRRSFANDIRDGYLISPQVLYTKARCAPLINPSPMIVDSIRFILHIVDYLYTHQRDPDAYYDIGLPIMSMKELLSVQEFCSFAKRLEEGILDKPDQCALDVYVMDTCKSKRIFPAYISPRGTDTRIELLVISSKDIHGVVHSHTFLITDKRWVFHNAEGKIFKTCSKCHQVFWNQSMLSCHKCGEAEAEAKNDGMAPNTSDTPEDSEYVGCCRKCNLLFHSQFFYDFHKKHCLMRYRSGSKHIRLAEYGDGATPTMSGVDPKDETHNSYSMLFADFESSIDPETGEHVFMSYGLYDCDKEVFFIGYDLKEFFSRILQRAETSDEDVRVFFHNAMNYDANYILREFIQADSRAYEGWSVKAMMETMNKLQRLSFTKRGKKKKYITVTIGDTFKFLTLSLERLVASMRTGDLLKDKQTFSRFFREFGKKYKVSDEQIALVLRKNLFPYKFFTSSVKLDTDIAEFARVFEATDENVPLFGTNVTKESLSEQQEQVLEVMRVYRCKSAREYHDIYLMCDVMQLADIFSVVCDRFKTTHHIDLTEYLGMPSASWAAFLRFKPDLSLRLYNNTFYAEFFQDMMRGGVTSAPLRYAKSDDTHTIVYLDVNGLYPYVMQEFKYPLGDFKWRPPIAVDQLDAYFAYLEQKSAGACLMVDLHTSDELKRRTDDYPFAPEHRCVKDEYLTPQHEYLPYIKKWLKVNGSEGVKTFIGLVGTHYDKKEYPVHWRLLQWYMKHGMEVKKVHFIIEFTESDYLKGYIHHNIELRNQCSDELSKTAYKLCGNSIYGKTCENPLNRCSCEILRNRESLEGLLEAGKVVSIKPIDEDNSIVRLDGEEVILDRPSYIGACVLEMAKLHMYRIFYDDLSTLFKKVELIYTDTDSFIVRLEHERGQDVIDMMNRDKEMIGKLGGQLKSETGKDYIDEVIALRSKFYGYVTKEGHFGKRAKGVTRSAQDEYMTWDTYRKMVFDLAVVDTVNEGIDRYNFTMRSAEHLKRISGLDGKRYICDDGIHTHAFGHPDIPSE